MFYIQIDKVFIPVHLYLCQIFVYVGQFNAGYGDPPAGGSRYARMENAGNFPAKT